MFNFLFECVQKTLTSARDFMRNYPYLVIAPGVAIMTAMFSFNRIGDGLRDALDPKLRN